MSHQATLSPSPIHQRFYSAFGRDSITPLAERRRLSHPHNPPHFARAADNMSDISHPVRPRPRLQHQTSRTLTIDLTDDTDDPPVISQSRARPRAPPQLGRSDGQAATVIDLTDDNDAGEDEPELEVTHTRQVPRRIPPPPPPLADSPPLFMPDSPPRFMPRAPRPGFHARMGHLAQRIGINRVFAAGRNGEMDQGGPDAGDFHGFAFASFGDHGVNFQVINAQMNAVVHQAMPGEMNYQRDAFADRKPDHIPPKPAKEGYTRSPTENDTIICPSCEEELVHNKQEEEPIVKKGGKEPTKKEREEHPFWVLRECGHVSFNRYNPL